MENLNYKLSDLSSVSKKAKVEIPYAMVQNRINEAFSSVLKTANIKGYRKGKAPEAVVRKHYDETIKYDVTEKLINEACAQVVQQNKLELVSYPRVSDINFKEGEPLVFEATFDVRPVFEPKNYKGLDLESFNAEPTEEEVEKIVLSFLESRSDMKTIMEDRPVSDADWVDIDFDGYINGEKQEKLSAKGYVCKIGDKMTIIDDLSKGISGMKSGSEKDISTKYPDDYHAEDIKGKEVTFKVKLNKIMERILPELTDEMVKELKLGNSKDEFYSNIKENIRARKNESRNSHLRKQVIDKLIEANKFEVSALEVERKVPEVQERALHNVFGHHAQKNLNESQKKEFFDKHMDEIRKVAEDEIRISYIIDAIAEKESIKAEEAELEKELEATARYMSLSLDKLKEKYGKDSLYRAASKGIIENKVYELIQGQAKITEKKEASK